MLEEKDLQAIAEMMNGMKQEIVQETTQMCIRDRDSAGQSLRPPDRGATKKYARQHLLSLQARAAAGAGDAAGCTASILWRERTGRTGGVLLRAGLSGPEAVFPGRRAGLRLPGDFL